MMNKTEAAQILNLDSAATADQVNTRYKQIRAFFTVHVDIGKNLIGLAALSMSRIHEAYEALPDTPSNQATDEKATAQASKSVNEPFSTYTSQEAAPKPAAAFTSNAQTTGDIKMQSTPPASKASTNGKRLKAFIFPHPLNTAGELFSDQWWKVFKRIVLISLAAMAFLFVVLPSLFDHPSSSATIGSPYVVPTGAPVAPSLPYGPTSPFPQ